MVIDTSAVAAIVFSEPESLRLLQAIKSDPKRLMSSFAALECGVVVSSRKGPSSLHDLKFFFHESCIEIVSFTAEQYEVALNAYLKFGKGNHPAKLNLGDCCSYALSQYSGEPLLFKGGDFSKTDVSVVVY